MPEGCDVIAVAPASSSTPPKRLLLPKKVLRTSIVENFASLTKALENLVTIGEAIHNGPTEDLSCFLECAELYFQPLSNQWLALQKQLRWLGVEADRSDQRCQEADISATCPNDDKSRTVACTSDPSLPSWANCPVALREQMACLIHVLQAQRREMDELQERISDLEEVYEEEDVCS